jgi:hypothetical protein
MFLNLFCARGFYFIDSFVFFSVRGAELIEELRQKQIMEQMERENQILENIKFKMERIKASQMKVQGPSYREPSSHFTGKYSLLNSPITG